MAIVDEAIRKRIGFGAMTAGPEPTLGVDASIYSGSCSASDGVAAQLINYRESQIFMSWVDWLTWACCNRKGPLSRGNGLHAHACRLLLYAAGGLERVYQSNGPHLHSGSRGAVCLVNRGLTCSCWWRGQRWNGKIHPCGEPWHRTSSSRKQSHSSRCRSRSGELVRLHRELRGT